MTFLAVLITILFALATLTLVTAAVQKDKTLLLNALLTVVTGLVLLSMPFVYRTVVSVVGGAQ
jgi:hypothetical protein